MYKHLRSKGQEVIVPIRKDCTVKRRPYILTADLPGTTPEEKPDWRTDVMTGWLRGAEDLGGNTRRYCHACGNKSSKIEFSSEGKDL